jgi:hypothetical protein
VFDAIRKKNLHQWMGDYLGHLMRRTISQREARHVSGPRHVLFAMCDHYEPLWGGATDEVGHARVDAWAQGYPTMASHFKDSHGRPPRHGWFFPGEEYRPRFLEQLGHLVRGGFGEVEVHLHHADDTEQSLRATFVDHLKLFDRHGHLSRDAGGKQQWAFIHGNWSLANSRPDGKWCGVDAELPLLFDLGCYADFTFPSAPDACQPNQVNKIYWPVGDLRARKCFEHGEQARVGRHYDDRLLMITGPLSLSRKPGGSLIPRIRLENGAVTGDDPATAARVASWVDQGIHVAGRPEWIFVKVHTHGALEKSAASLLGYGGHALHQALQQYNDGQRHRLHYVTAREMFNIARAAMDGRSGDPADYYDYLIAPPPAASQ